MEVLEEGLGLAAGDAARDHRRREADVDDALRARVWQVAAVLRGGDRRRVDLDRLEGAVDGRLVVAAPEEEGLMVSPAAELLVLPAPGC